MLQEKAAQLANRIDALLEILASEEQTKESLRTRIDGLRSRTSEIEELRRENAELRGGLAQMEKRLAASAGKEKEVRERLHTIIAKIDALEKETGEA